MTKTPSNSRLHVITNTHQPFHIQQRQGVPATYQPTTLRHSAYKAVTLQNRPNQSSFLQHPPLHPSALLRLAKADGSKEPNPSTQSSLLLNNVYRPEEAASIWIEHRFKSSNILSQSTLVKGKLQLLPNRWKIQHHQQPTRSPTTNYCDKFEPTALQQR
ncbi:hypothetical protein Nepgr_007858 [Nepenthes gracilis]|uniref:Uncharacterized protein n=1 Tax=Nepenthes gracilis TaxID=150966 RepID=A0AAD3S7M3_NEPGR|nr:hypothetical protein Nepgr_007858 [Nepenthes gracilis]